MKDIARKSLMAASLLAAALVLPSCENDDFASGKKGKAEGEVTVSVNTKNELTTRAGSYEQFEAVELKSDGMTLFLTGSKSVFNENILGESAKTRGEIVTTDSIHIQRSSFDVNVLNNGADYAGIAGTINNKIVYSGGKWKFQEEVDWPDAEPKALDFWAYSYGSGSTFTRGTDYKSFEFTGPTPGTSRTDASLMQDLLVAHTGAVDPRVNDKNITESDVEIHFYHALAAVRFDVADVFNSDNNSEDPMKYVSVLVTGIKKDGKGTYNGGMSYGWETTGDVVTYEQVLYDDSKGEGNELSSLNDRTMFFIPQDLTDVRFTFRLVNASQNKEYVLSTNEFGTNKWEAGYIYNYTIGKDVWGSVGIEVAETFDQASGKKEDVKVSNTRSSAAYVRATVVANWCTSGTTSKVYAPYEGQIIYNTEDWIYNESDGYYYSKRPLTGYSDSEALIEQFTCPSQAPDSPYKIHLEMNIIAQAVTYDQKDGHSYTMEWAWDVPQEVYNQIENL